MPTTTRKGYADGPTGQIHFQEAGAGLPLILCHQSPASSDMFRMVYHRLAERGIRAIGVDTPGFGMSDIPADIPSIADYADAMLAVLDHLHLDQCAWLGHHTGASIAAEVAVRVPQRATRVVLNGPAVLTEDERDEFRQALKQAPSFEIHADGSHLKNIWERRVHFTPGWRSVAAMHAGVVQMLIAGETEWYGHNAAFAHDISVLLKAMTQPALILTNTGDDIYYAAQRARQLRPDFAYVELAGGTHDIVEEQPDAWSDAVAGFLKAA